MNRIGTVARLHLVDRFSYTWLVWGVLTFVFVLNAALFAVIPQTQPTGNFTGALITIYIFMTVIGIQAATRFLPFAFTLGVSRRTYYLGTVALVVSLTAIYSVILTGLWGVEKATEGWGVQMNFFGVPWILDGPWYQVLITNFVLLTLTFLTGLWCGLIHRRFGLVGTVLFLGAVTLVVVGAVVLVTWGQWWSVVGAFLADLDILAASGILAIVAVLVALGGYATIRRVTV